MQNEFQYEEGSFEQLILEHVYRDHYRPVKPKVIFKKLELPVEFKREFKRALKRLIREKQVSWGPSHLVMKRVPRSISQDQDLEDPSASESPSERRIGSNDFSSRSQENSGAENLGENLGASQIVDGQWQEVVYGQSDSPEFETLDSRREKKREEKRNRTGKKDRHPVSVGRFRRSSNGNGYIYPITITDDLQESSEEELRQLGETKVFVLARDGFDATSGDIVKFAYRVKTFKGKKETVGKVRKILTRRTNQFVGTYFQRGGYGYVSCDGKQFTSPIEVGDAGAKDVESGDKVVIEMIRFPTDTADGQGVIVEVLGKFGQPNLDTLLIMRQYELPESFDEQVLQEARDQAVSFQEEPADSKRRDLRNTTIVTIDPKDARDFDDAISLKRLENGHWSLGVHIADVSHFVRPNTPLDIEAYKRGTSVYLPDRVIPMIPEIVSNGLASLQPGKLRFTISAEIELTADGALVGTEFFRGQIQSAHRFTYEEVDEYLEDPDPWKEKLDPDVFRLVRDMHTLAMILRNRRMDGGALEMHLPEVRLKLDREGQVEGAAVAQNTESHQMIEEFMLMANVAVAQQLTDLGHHVVRRIHLPPNEKKLADLTSFVQELGIQCESLQNRFELKRVLEETAESPVRHAVHFGVLKSMQKAIYSPKEAGHFALNFDNYCHFTSPIRRYPDLIIHRMLGDVIDGKKPNDQFQSLQRSSDHCSERERIAEQAERDLVKLKLIMYCRERIGQKMEATITGVESYGVFAQGVAIPAEGLVPREALPEDTYFYDDRSRQLMGRRAGNVFRLGDKVEVEIVKADVNRRELDFRVTKSFAKHKVSSDVVARVQSELDTFKNKKKGGRKGPPKKRRRRK